MPDLRRRFCVCCGKHTDEVGVLSWKGYCRPCGKALLAENVEGIAARRGPAYRRQLRGVAKWLERERLDVPRGSA